MILTFDLIKSILSWWALIGFFYLVTTRKIPKTKKEALVMVFFGGPLAWILVPLYGWFHLQTKWFRFIMSKVIEIEKRKSR